MYASRSAIGMRCLRVLVVIALFAVACTSSADSGAVAEGNSAVDAPAAETAQAGSARPTVPPSPTQTSEVQVPTPTPPTVVPDPPQVIYVEDFGGDVGDEWSHDTVDLSPIGERLFLGQFTNDNVMLELESLPAHDVLTVSMDLFILRSWDGGGSGQNDRWLMRVDGYPVVNATFSNDNKPQTYPLPVGVGLNTGTTDAVETDSLGFTFRFEDNLADSVYRIERRFLHTHDQLQIQLSGRNLSSVDDESWGIDNVSIEVSSLPEGDSATQLRLQVGNGRLSASGILPTNETRDLAEKLIEASFGTRVDRVEFATGDGSGPVPLWFFSLGEILSILRPSVDMTLLVDEQKASVVGTARTGRWQQTYLDRLTRALLPQTRVSFDIDVVLGPEVVEEVESMRLLFPTADASLTDDHRATLDRLAQLLTDHPALTVRIDGHTDAVGDEQANRDLSKQRAQAALDYLLLRGADDERLTTRSAGATDPELESTADPASIANRRVVFIIPRG